MTQAIREYRLTGNFPLAVVGVLLCGSMFIALAFATTPRYHVSRLSSMMNLAGLTPSQQIGMLRWCMAIVCVALVAKTLLAPWCTRTLVVTSDVLNIVRSTFSGGATTVLSLRDIRNVDRIVRDRNRYMLDFETLGRLREEVRFQCGNSTFRFSSVQFRSYREFDDFCARISTQ
jgi:hypothetical protein